MSASRCVKSRRLKECKLLVLGALAEGPKNAVQISRQTGLSYAEVYVAWLELHRERKIVMPIKDPGP